MDKQFEVNGVKFGWDHQTALAAFGFSMMKGTKSHDEVERDFDALEIGETLIDEDGDTWERIA